MTEPIRILHVIGVMGRGGAENMIMNLYRRIDRTKIQFDFVQNDGMEAAFEEEINALGGRIYRCPRYRGKNHLAYVRWWNRFFKEHWGEYPIVHGHIGSTAAIYLNIAKRHGAYAIAHSHSAGKGSILYQMLSYPTRFVADYFFACAEDAGRVRFGKKVCKRETGFRVLNNAIDSEKFRFHPDCRHRMREELRIPREALVIGHVGRFAEVKNHLFLLEIFAEIHKIRPDAVLLLVGDGELRTQIETSITEKHLEHSVIMAGLRSDVWNSCQAMDVFVFPSIYEGIPVSLVEAQAAGLPCCVSTGVPREAAITDLVQFRSLKDTPEQWEQWVLERAKLPRRDMAEEICRAGYDISETSRWLQNYYLEVVKNRE